MRSRRHDEKEAKLRAAMAPLVADQRFQDYMDLIREMKDGAVEFAATHDSVKDARATISALGSVRTYLDIISVYDSARSMVEDEQARFAEQQAQGSGEQAS